jgi:hypothetical protein
VLEEGESPSVVLDGSRVLSAEASEAAWAEDSALAKLELAPVPAELDSAPLVAEEEEEEEGVAEPGSRTCC